MCGRYTLSDPGDLLEELGIEPGEELRPRFNIAPTQLAPVARQTAAGGHQLDHLRWGLVPFWAKDLSIGSRMINARAETVAEKPSFRNALRQRRCLVLSDGFYEWRKLADGKQPHHIRLISGRPFVFAGLWERWDKGEQPIETFTIITTEASDDVRQLHHRMPVILDGETRDLWLDPRVEDKELLTSLLLPYPAGSIEHRPVSRVVNSPRNDSPACLAPIES